MCWAGSRHCGNEAQTTFAFYHHRLPRMHHSDRGPGVLASFSDQAWHLWFSWSKHHVWASQSHFNNSAPSFLKKKTTVFLLFCRRRMEGHFIGESNALTEMGTLGLAFSVTMRYWPWQDHVSAGPQDPIHVMQITLAHLPKWIAVSFQWGEDRRGC